jgi:hypothetical protein
MARWESRSATARLRAARWRQFHIKPLAAGSWRQVAGDVGEVDELGCELGEAVDVGPVRGDLE